MMGKSFYHKSLNIALVLAILYVVKTNNNNLNVEDIPLLLKQWKKKGIFGGEKDISTLDFRTMIMAAASPASFILKSIRLLFLLLENLDLLIRTVDCFASLLSYF